jgi:hypothetical protein
MGISIGAEWFAVSLVLPFKEFAIIFPTHEEHYLFNVCILLACIFITNFIRGDFSKEILRTTAVTLVRSFLSPLDSAKRTETARMSTIGKVLIAQYDGRSVSDIHCSKEVDLQGCLVH